MIGRVAKIIKKEKNGQCVFSFDTTDKNAKRQPNGEVHCMARISRVFEAMPVELSGHWENDLFICEDLKPSWMGTRTMTTYLKKSCKGTGLGEKTIKIICFFYKEKIFDYEKEDFKRSLEENFPRLNEKQITALLSAIYQTRQGLFELEDILCAENINYGIIQDIYEQYHEHSVEVIKANPYSIGRTFGYPLKAADNIAFRFRIPPLDTKRIEGLICYALDYAASGGNTFMYADELADRVSTNSMRSLYHCGIPAIYVSCTIISSRKLMQEQNKIALRDILLAEKMSAKKLNAIRQQKIHLTVTDDKIEEIGKELDFQYGNDQKNAFHLLETGGVNILTGGPGTGKTSSVKGIIHYYLKENPGAEVAFVAPTGRAAKRLSESSGYPAKTIHKFLDLKPYEVDMDIDAPVRTLDVDFLVVDETSMLDIILLFRLLKALPDTCRILFVGDENQLPSIGPGNVLHDMIAGGKIPVYRLEENFRQKNGGSVYENGKRILSGQMPVAHADFQIFRAKDEKDAYTGLCYLIRQYYDKGEPLKTQVIEPSRKGAAGTYKINQYVHTDITHKNVPGISPQPSVHDKIIFNHTDYSLGYVNGDIGIIESMNADEIVADIGERIIVPAASIHDMELGYAYTIHKSQGSENDTVIIYLSEEMSHMMTRSLLYTAVTRAKNMVVIVYTGNALRECILNTSDTVRNTRLAEFL